MKCAASGAQGLSPAMVKPGQTLHGLLYASIAASGSSPNLMVLTPQTFPIAFGNQTWKWEITFQYVSMGQSAIRMLGRKGTTTTTMTSNLKPTIKYYFVPTRASKLDFLNIPTISGLCVSLLIL
jgi:hypothetical protein